MSCDILTKIATTTMTVTTTTTTIMGTILYESANKVEEEVCKQEVDLVCTDKPMTECREVQFQVSTL